HAPVSRPCRARRTGFPFAMGRDPPRPPLFPYTTLFRSVEGEVHRRTAGAEGEVADLARERAAVVHRVPERGRGDHVVGRVVDVELQRPHGRTPVAGLTRMVASAGVIVAGVVGLGRVAAR